MPRNFQEAKDDRLLIPAVQAARNLGISRRALRNRINAGLVRSVHVGPRVYIPKTEIERIVNGEPAEHKPQPHSDNSSSGKISAEHGKFDLAAKSPKERLDEILGGYAAFVERYNAGDRETVAAWAFAKARGRYGRLFRIFGGRGGGRVAPWGRVLNLAQGLRVAVRCDSSC